MSKEAEIFRKRVSFHNKQMRLKSRESRGLMYLKYVSRTKSDSQLHVVVINHVERNQI